MAESIETYELPLSVRSSLARRMAMALHVVCDAGDDGVQPYQAFGAARQAENEMEAVRRDLIWELLNKHGGHDPAVCECNDYGVDDAIAAVRYARAEAERQHRPMDDRFMDMAEYRRRCVEAAQWTSHCIEHLLAE